MKLTFLNDAPTLSDEKGSPPPAANTVGSRLHRWDADRDTPRPRTQPPATPFRTVRRQAAIASNANADTEEGDRYILITNDIVIAQI